MAPIPSARQRMAHRVTVGDRSRPWAVFRISDQVAGMPSPGGDRCRRPHDVTTPRARISRGLDNSKRVWLKPWQAAGGTFHVRELDRGHTALVVMSPVVMSALVAAAVESLLRRGNRGFANEQE